MTPEEKFKTPTQWIWNKSGSGTREVMAENKFRYIFRTGKDGKCVCLVRTDNLRKWLYQFDWMVPYFPDGEQPISKVPEFDDPDIFNETTNAHLESSNDKKVIEIKRLKTDKEDIKEMFKKNKRD